MNKGLLLKVFLLFTFFCQLVNKAQAQYAVGGAANPVNPSLVGSVYWLTWNNSPGSTLISAPSGFNNTQVVPSQAPFDYVWEYSPTVRISATVGTIGQPFNFGSTTETRLAPYTPGTYLGDGLDVLFNGNGITVKDGNNSNSATTNSRGVPYSAVANATNAGLVQFNISIRLQIYINGVWTTTPYPGMVLADAESMATNAENIDAITDGTTPWQLIALYKGTEVVAGSQDKYVISFSNGGAGNGTRFKLQTLNGTGNANINAVMYAHGVTSLRNVTVKGEGKTALSIGFILPFDMGDAKGYKKPGAYINGFTIDPKNTFLTGTNVPLNSIPITPLVPIAKVWLGDNTGTKAVDPDGDITLNELATTDDLTDKGDDDAINAGAINIKVNTGTTVNIPISNITHNDNAIATAANVYGWIDFNGNNKFEDDEATEAITAVPSMTSATNRTLTFLPAKIRANALYKTGKTKMRVRVTTTTPFNDTDGSATDSRSESYSGDGEVEDYEISLTGITISGNVYHDPTGSGTGSLISTVGTPAQALKAYLVKGSVIKQKVSVSVGGTYTFTNVDNGTDYKILLSVKDVDINTAAVADITTGAMPAGWGSSGDFFGLNNLLSSSQGTNIKDGTNDLQVLLSTPIAGQDVTLVNFSLNQIPTANSDAVSTNANTLVQIPVLTNTPAGTFADADVDGTIDATKVFLLDPNTSTYKQTAFTVIGQGEYTVSNTTGVVTFTPLTTFTGVATPVTYTVRDNGEATSNTATITVTVKPVGSTDTYNEVAGAPTYTNAVLGNDAGAGNNATVVLTTPITSGTGSIALNGTSTGFVYTPAGYTGTTTYKYKIKGSDGVTLSDEITVNITVKPVGSTDTYNEVAGAPTYTNAVLGNDAGAGNNATVVLTTPITSGTGSVALNGTSTGFVYTPAGYTGTTTYGYKIKGSDGVTLSDEIMVNITVKPVAKANTFATVKNTELPINILSDDDQAGTGAKVTSVPSNTTQGGTLTNVNLANGTMTYTPLPGFTGTDTFQYSVTSSDNTLTSSLVTVTLTVTENLLAGANDVDYVASYKSYKINNTTVTETATQVTTDVLANDPDGNQATIDNVTNGSNGTTTLANNKINYTPNPDFVGTDTYTYKFTKPGGASSTITVTIHVSGITLAKKVTNTAVIHSAGETINYEFKVKNVGPVTLTNVVVTDAGVDANSILPSANIGSLAANAEVTLTAKYTVKPADVAAGKYSNQATVTATDPKSPTPNNITSKSDNPSIINTTTDTNPYDPTEVAIIPLPAAISLAKTGVQAGNNINYTFTITNTGTTNLNTVTLTDTKLGLAPVLVPVPNGVLVPNASVTYNAVYALTTTDNSTGSVTNTATVSAKDPGNNDVTGTGTTLTTVLTGVDDSDKTPVNTPVTTNVLGNDGTSGTGNPTVTATPGSKGTTLVNANGSVTYTPESGYIGTDTYTYTIKKGNDVSAPITVTINVYSATMSLSKKAENGYSTVGEKIYYTLILKNTGTVPLTNVEITDVKADPLSISQPLILTLAVGDTKTVTAYHTTVADDVTGGRFENQAVAKGKDPKGNDVIKASDDPTTTSTPDDPTVVLITPGSPASINLAKTGSFAGNQITYTFIITNNGGVPLNTITLTDAKLGLSNISIPTPNGLSSNQSVTYNATYTLTQADKDLGAVNNTATVSAKDPNNNPVTGTGSTVTTVPTSPVAVNDVAETNADTPEIISVLTNDNPGNSTFNLTSVEVVTNPLHGAVVINPNGTITYAPNTGYVGNDSFTYKVKDAYGYVTNIATVNITVKEVKELKIPTLFSPNGDGVNDGFVIKDLEDYAQNELVVINRWGNEVYRQADYKNNWSGTGLNEGTYFYIVRLKKSNGESWVVRKGYVTLIRTFRK